MKKNLTKKLMLSVLTLAFAVVSLGASTFAWFTTSENAKVDQISYDVTSDAGLEVAVSKIDGSAISNYYIGTLPQDQIEAVVAATGFTAFNAVSYYDGVSAAADFVPNAFYQHASYTKEVESGAGTEEDPYVYKNVKTAGAAATSGYVAFQLNVRVDQDGYIKLLVPYLTSTGKASWTAGVAYNSNNAPVAANKAMEYDVLAASRLAVVPSANTTLSQALYQAEEVTATADAVGNTIGLSNKGALEIYNAKYDGEDSDIPAIPEGLDGFTEVASGAVNELVFQATAGTVYEFEVYIWIEGYDAECANAIFSQALAAKFAFQYDADNTNWPAYDWSK